MVECSSILRFVKRCSFGSHPPLLRDPSSFKMENVVPHSCNQSKNHERKENRSTIYASTMNSLINKLLIVDKRHILPSKLKHKHVCICITKRDKQNSEAVKRETMLLSSSLVQSSSAKNSSVNFVPNAICYQNCSIIKLLIFDRINSNRLNVFLCAVMAVQDSIL